MAHLSLYIQAPGWIICCVSFFLMLWPWKVCHSNSLGATCLLQQWSYSVFIMKVLCGSCLTKTLYLPKACLLMYWVGLLSCWCVFSFEVMYVVWPVFNRIYGPGGHETYSHNNSHHHYYHHHHHNNNSNNNTCCYIIIISIIIINNNTTTTTTNNNNNNNILFIALFKL